MRKLKRIAVTDDLDLLREIDRLARTARLFIAAVGGSLAFLFTWLTLRDVPIADVVAHMHPDVIRRFALAAYYLCWVWGTTFDVATQQAVYIHDPKRGRMPAIAVGIVFILFVVAALLLWANRDDRNFAIALTSLFAINVISWKILLIRIRPIITASRRRYNEKEAYFGLERLNVVSEYIAGKSQKHRFYVMCLLVMVADTLCFAEPVREFTTRAISRVFPGSPPGTLAPLLTDGALVAFIFVAETWIWMMRVRTRMSLQIIAALSERYVIERRGGQAKRRS